jgi:hypothetical protein
LAAYLLHTQKLEKNFEVLDLHHIPRVDNVIVDDLSTKVSTWALVPDGIFERQLQRPIARPTIPGEGGETSASKVAVPAVLIPWSMLRIVGITGDSMHLGAQDPDAQVGLNTWIIEIRTYLKDNILFDDASADRIAPVAKRYILVEGDLYQRGANGIQMQCITREEGYELLIEIHGGECDNHASFRTLVDKAFRHDFYCPTSIDDAVELVKTCRACLFHTKQIHTLVHTLQMIPLSWPFTMWGLDILGTFPRAVGGYQYLYITINKFTKWLEATPMVKINKQFIVKFIKSIVYRFGEQNHH